MSTNLAVSNWLIVPAPWRVDAPPPPADQRWLLFLSGIAVVNLKGTGSEWSWDRHQIEIDISAALQSTGRQASPGRSLVFQVERSTPYATVNSIFDQNTAINAGFAVDSCRLVLGTVGKENVPDVFGADVLNRGVLEVDLAVRDVDAWIYRVGYTITLLGRLVEISPAPFA